MHDINSPGFRRRRISSCVQKGMEYNISHNFYGTEVKILLGHMLFEHYVDVIEIKPIVNTCDLFIFNK